MAAMLVATATLLVGMRNLLSSTKSGNRHLNCLATDLRLIVMAGHP